VYSRSPEWYVIRTKPRQEDRANASLRALGLKTLNPKVCRASASKVASRTTPHDTPLFPNYLFAYFTLEEMFNKVRWSRGVHKIVEFGGIPAIVGDATMSVIRSRLGANDMTLPAAPLVAGDSVHIVHGPFRDLVGIFERDMPDEERAVVLLSHLQFQAHVVIDKRSAVMVDHAARSKAAG
jgi:transcriptional antiterminator RfaH